MSRKSHDPKWLEARGYDGLYARVGGDECGCSIHDFAPCLEGPFPECVPAEQRDIPDGPVLFFPAKLRRKVKEPR